LPSENRKSANKSTFNPIQYILGPFPNVYQRPLTENPYIEEVREAMHAAVPFYNNERPHRSIEMLTPMEAAGRTGRFKRGWMSYRERAIDNLDRETLPP
jgi:transposase InsO family protein